MITTTGKLVTCRLNELDHHPLNTRSIHEYNRSGNTVQTIEEFSKSLHSDGILTLKPLRAIAGKPGERNLVFDGNRTLEALLRFPNPESVQVQVILLPNDTSAKDVIRLSISANEGLKPSMWSKLIGLESLVKLGTTKGKELSEALKVSEAEVSQMMKLLKMSPSIREAGERGLIAATEALSILKNEGEKAEIAILKYLEDHPNTELTKAKFELTRAADSAKEIARKVQLEFDEECKISKLAFENHSRANEELKTAEGKRKEQLEKEAQAFLDAHKVSQEKLKELAQKSKEASEAAAKIEADAKKARQGGKGSKGKRKSSDKGNKKGQGGTEAQKFVTATEVLCGKLESLLTANFAGTEALAQRTQVMNGCVKLLNEFRGKFLKT